MGDVYTGTKSWSDLREEAGASTLPAGSNEAVLRRACGRLLQIDDIERIAAYKTLLTGDAPPALEHHG